MTDTSQSKFLETFGTKLHDQHMRLRLLLRGIDEVFEARSSEQEGERLAFALVVLLEDLMRELHDHFEFEESGGYFGDVQDAAPYRGRELDALKHDHIDLSERATTVLKLSKEALKQSSRWSEVENGFTAFASRLRAHERRENNIIQEVFLTDVGEND